MRIRSSHNFSQQHESGIGQSVSFEKRVERYILAMMAQLATVDVERRCSQFSGPRRHLGRWCENKLRDRIDELLDEPRTGYPVDLYLFPCNPFHNYLASFFQMSVQCLETLHSLH